MGKVLIIGAGGVGTVVAHKVAQNPDVFTEIMIASRTKSKCDAIVKAIGNPNIQTAQVDADMWMNWLLSLIASNRNRHKRSTSLSGSYHYGRLVLKAESTIWTLPTMSRKMWLTLNTAGNGHIRNVLRMPD